MLDRTLHVNELAGIHSSAAFSPVNTRLGNSVAFMLDCDPELNGTIMVEALDPRIGQLQRANGLAHYAFRGDEYREGTPKELLAWLDGNVLTFASTSRTGRQAKKRRQVHEYSVRVELKYPAWNDRPFDKVVFARTARDAEKSVREWMFQEGHTRIDGPLILKATRLNND